MPGALCVARFTSLGLTVVSASGYTGYIGSRERITPMYENEKIAAVGRVAASLHATLVEEFRSPMGSADVKCEWTGEDFNRIFLTTPAGDLHVIVTSAAGEEGADVRVVVLDSEDLRFARGLRAACVRELGRVARAVDAISGVEHVWPDANWPKTFLVSVRSGGDDL